MREAPDGPRRTLHKLDFTDAERPLGIQIYGASELSMEQAGADRHRARPPTSSTSTAAAG